PKQSLSHSQDAHIAFLILYLFDDAVPSFLGCGLGAAPVLRKMKSQTITVPTIPPNIKGGAVSRLHFLYIIFSSLRFSSPPSF
ncbi:hypothetical protein PJJ87_29195, partial [Mycobacterium kansasii]